MSGRRERYETPDSLPVSPPSTGPMDPLLDLLRDMQLTGGVFLDAEFTAPWCVKTRMGMEDCRASCPDVPRHRLPLRDRGEVSGRSRGPRGDGGKGW